MGRRRRAREYALQVLFQIDLTEGTHDEVLEAFWAGREAEEDVRRFAESLVRGVCREREELDRKIVGSARNWRLERMAVVDRNVLRVAVYEMLQDETTPPAVVIDEAIEIARKFGSGDSGSFINGVLDSVRRRLEDQDLPAATDVGADGVKPAAAILFALAAGALFATGCGYRLAGTGAPGFIPDHIEVMVVVPFENRTSRPEIEQRVTEEVALELSKRGGYKVLTDSATADARLEGAVTSYRTIPVQFGVEGRATRVEAMVTLQATLRKIATDEILWSQTGLTFREQFDVPEGEDFFDRESIALDTIARGAAGALVSSIFEGF